MSKDVFVTGALARDLELRRAAESSLVAHGSSHDEKSHGNWATGGEGEGGEVEGDYPEGTTPDPLEFDYYGNKGYLTPAQGKRNAISNFKKGVKAREGWEVGDEDDDYVYTSYDSGLEVDNPEDVDTPAFGDVRLRKFDGFIEAKRGLDDELGSEYVTVQDAMDAVEEAVAEGVSESNITYEANEKARFEEIWKANPIPPRKKGEGDYAYANRLREEHGIYIDF